MKGLEEAIKMNRDVIFAAKKLFDLGWKLVPCNKHSKSSNCKDILTKDYVVDDFNVENNIAVNLGKTNLIDWDCDSLEACLISEKILANSGGCSLMSVPLDKSRQGDVTHYFFTQDLDYSQFSLERLDLNGKKMIELRSGKNYSASNESSKPSITDYSRVKPIF